MANQTLSSRLNVGVAQIVVPGTSSGLVSASGLTGNTTGSAIAAGFVGEVITGGAITTTSLTTSEATISSITLTAGVWMLMYQATVYCQTGATTANNTFAKLRISDNAGSATIGVSARLFQCGPAISSTANFAEGCLVATEFLTPSTSTTYLFRGVRVDGAGTGTASVLQTATEGTIFKALRIA